jgi:tagaturonate reductase
LNGSHTLLAAIGTLLGLRTVRDAIEDRLLDSFVESAIFQEIIPATGSGEEAQNGQYARETLARFRNPAVEHQLVSICLNCSTKVGVRLFPSIRNFTERRRGLLPRRLLFGVAAAMVLLRESDVEDAHREFIREMWARVDSQSLGSVLALVQSVLAKQIEWSREQIDLRAIAPAVAEFVMKIREQGLRSTMESGFGVQASHC